MRRTRSRLLSIAALAGASMLVAAPALACPVDATGRGSITQAVYAHVLGHPGAVLPSAKLGAASFAAPSAGNPSSMDFQTTLTRNPDDSNAPAFETPDSDCVAPSCKDITITVPAGSNQTLYARAAWPQTTQYVHIWGIKPDGTFVGKSDVASSVDKSVGNTDVAPVAEFAVANPAAGTWHIQVRAVFGYQIPVTGSVALVSGKLLQLPQLDVTKLADSYLTQNVTYNIVTVNRTLSKAELQTFKDVMPTTFRNAVLEKQFADGCAQGVTDQVTETTGTLTNWGTEHFCGTAGGGSTGNVPYFEPLKANITTRFLQADTSWTKDLFAVMKANTKQDQPFTVVKAIGLDGTSISVNPSRNQNTQGNYMAHYDSTDGKLFRGTGATVADPTKGDLIDPFPVEDWIFNHRNDAKYKTSFMDLSDGSKHSGAFINPDSSGYFDPFYNAKGKNLNHMPQGPTTSFTFFMMDTFDGELAQTYFRPTAYHYFDVSQHEVDPDDGSPDGPPWMRAWGGRYHFFLHDLGAGPNYYESSDTVLTNEVAGSANYPNGDPPVWDYDQNPQWSGQLITKTARDAQVWLFARFEASYLYRPVPADVYLVANNNWEDCDSNPQCSTTGISYTDLSKIYHADYVNKNLGAALPGATFNNETQIPGLQTYRYLGCSKDIAVSNQSGTAALGTVNNPAGGQTVLVPNTAATCKSGLVNDPIQEAMELAKARGDDTTGVGVNDQGASAAVMRAFVEENRKTIAPQPAGQFTITNISVVWPQAITWDLPALVGGVAFGTPNNEAWGVLNNTNDRVKPASATDCSKSLPVAPGCNGVPPISPGAGFSYTIEHESSHFLGLTHPHDYISVEKGADGKFDYYAEGLSEYGDFSMAPTTYAGAFAPYSVLDQDIIQRGHAAEYLRQTQDYVADAYQQDAMKGLASISADTAKKQNESSKWRDLSSTLYQCGDYLHAEFAMRNASLAAQGVYGPIVEPRQLKAGEKVLFRVDGQASYDPDGKLQCAASKGATSPASVKTTKHIKKPVTKPVVAVKPAKSLAATGGSPWMPLVGGALVVLGAAVVGRRRQLTR